MAFDPDWKERREKIEGYYRAIGKMGMNDMGKIKAVVVKSGDKLIVELDDGDGILYEIIEDLINPLRMIKTLSENEIKEYSWFVINLVKKKLIGSIVALTIITHIIIHLSYQ